MENGGRGGAAPTGCYKCGRPGHWSRDCPSNPNSNPTNNSSNPSSSFTKTGTSSGGFGGPKPVQKAIEKPKKVPRTRPKLTPELLLSDDGLGYVLRHFPRAFKYRGRGHEVTDLGNLLGLYAEWHSHLIPYYSFDQFVHKVEQVGTTKRVKMCLNGLRERVANGGDLTKLHESPVEQNTTDKDGEAMNTEDPWLVQEDASMHDHPADIQEDMLHDMYEQAVEVTAPTLHVEKNKESEVLLISEEQKARIEANRLKALEKAAARAQSAAPEAKNTEDPPVQEVASMQDHTADIEEDVLQEFYEQAIEETAPALRIDSVSTRASSEHNSSGDLPNEAQEVKESEAPWISGKQKTRMEVIEEDISQELYEQAIEETAPALHVDSVSTQHNSSGDLPNQAQKVQESEAVHISEEQRARIEANRLKALEKAAAARARAAAKTG